MILDERTSQDLTVVLDWNQDTDECVVYVSDAYATWELRPADRDEAQSMYFHPYAYTPRNMKFIEEVTA